MYATKIFNVKVAESYLNIGDPYDKQHKQQERNLGKQFLTNPSKKGQLAGYFSPFAYATDSYQDSNKYIVTQPRDHRKLGFGTHDANRRDEFTLDIRAKQYRELMQHEKNWEKDLINKRREQRENNSENNNDSTDIIETNNEPSIPCFQTSIPQLAYDIGRTEQGRTPDCAKCFRDTFYCPHRLDQPIITSEINNADTKTMSPNSTSTNVIPNIRGQRRVDQRSHYNEHFSGINNNSLGHQPQWTHRISLRDFQDQNHLSVGKGF